MDRGRRRAALSAAACAIAEHRTLAGRAAGEEEKRERALVAARDQLPRTNGNKVDLTKVALMQGGYVEDENGNLYHPDRNRTSGLYWLRGGTAS